MLQDVVLIGGSYDGAREAIDIDRPVYYVVKRARNPHQLRADVTDPPTGPLEIEDYHCCGLRFPDGIVFEASILGKPNRRCVRCCNCADYLCHDRSSGSHHPHASP
jgi:hypothetical protein